MPRRNNKARAGRGDRGRKLKPGEKRCPQCQAITKPEHHNPRHQLGCPERKR